ncbi:hypothetical protein SEMRO_655_G182280.1 [Seminavis robusta]|uniref:Uncharacterized protein n=1 Tax=Seminavis robusta TaxID=568900 RepID=A0A9N8E4Y0_9STRA|nr:hypothetical protein SEMRO_655_G182280.1 [Seminavis robusta]|eukprot:Sro655_g182280.1 n/a (103) ;mRNA; r:29672-29980
MDGTEKESPIGPVRDCPDGMNEDNWCRSCGEWGHKRSTSKACVNNKKNAGKFPSVEELATMTLPEQESTQTSLLDNIPLNNDNSTEEELHKALVDDLMDLED